MIRDAHGRPVIVEAPSPLLAPWVTAMQDSQDIFELDSSRAGVDVRHVDKADLRGGRGRLKLFAPEPTMAVAFFYKPSRLPQSTDRFAYGALVHRRIPPTLEEVQSGLEFLRRGLHPDARPQALRRAFSFDVPQ
jgi:hypothetical protein